MAGPARAAWTEAKLRLMAGRWHEAAARFRAGGGLGGAADEGAAAAFGECADEVDALLAEAAGIPEETAALAAALAETDDEPNALTRMRLARAVRSYLDGGGTDHLAAARWHLERLSGQQRAVRRGEQEAPGAR